MSFRIVLKPSIKEAIRRIAWYGAWLVGGGMLVAGVFAFSFFTAMRVEMRASQVKVPDLVGQPLEGARQATDPLELVLQVVDQRNDPRVRSGLVLEQVPPAGASVRRGRKVKLILSLGGKVLSVPDLVGSPSREVVIRLRQEGFTPGDEAQVHSYDAEVGRILAQVPPAETSVVANSRIHRLVSRGAFEAIWVMPELVGRGRGEVEGWIARNGFRRGAVRSMRAAGREPGTVVAQLPKAGYPIRSKDIVELVVAE